MDVQKLSITYDERCGRKVVNDRFQLLQSIGQGQFGKVLLAKDTGPERRSAYVAIKTINRVDRTKLITKTYLSHTTKIKREIKIMKDCNHPNVVKLYQVIDDLKFDKILLILEYCQFGEIDWKRYNHYHEKYFKDHDKGIPLNKILRDVVNGLDYLHTYKHIIHRDLKPSNLLISSDRTIKISDFGVSLILENNANDDKELGKTMGTPAFYAPELCQFVNNRLLMLNELDLKRSKIDALIDIWSLGVVLYCLIFHQLPFEGLNEYSLFKNIVNGELKFPNTKEGSHVVAADLKELDLLKSLISRLLAKDPLKRPTLAEIKTDPFTTFDLSRAEADKFKNFNRELMKAQNPLAAEAWASENKLTTKIKKFLIGSGSSTATPVPPSQLPLTVKLRELPEPQINIAELEKVDDLLDSYLDDSSSFGSAELDTEPEVVDTTNLLDFGSTSTLKKSQSSFSNSSKLSIPPPLKLSASTFDSNLLVNALTAPHSPFSGQRTPVSANSLVTIGAGSPLSIKSMFSPSKRFFSRLTKQPKPTITSLSSPIELQHMGGFKDLEPPPTFGREQRYSADLIQSAESGKNSRKTSFSLIRSNGLSKISSSSSSLNLHAYLTDSPPTQRESVGSNAAASESDSDNEAANRTLTMDEFLDRMD